MDTCSIIAELVKKSTDLDELTHDRFLDLAEPLITDQLIIDLYFERHGIKEIETTILGILMAHGDLNHFYKIILGEIELPTMKDLKTGEFPEKLNNLGLRKKTLFDLAQVNETKNGITVGKFEILCCCFLQDAIKDSKLVEWKNGDVWIKQTALEIKADNARMVNQLGMILEPVDKKFNELIKENYNVSKKFSLYTKQQNMKEAMEYMLDNTDISKEELMTYIGISICQACPEMLAEEVDDFCDFLKRKVDDFIIRNEKENSYSLANLTQIWGVFDIFNYQHYLEHFDYLVFFSFTKSKNKNKEITGIKEKLFSIEDMKSFDSIYNNMVPYLKFVNFPRNGKRECTVQVTLI